MSREQPVAPLNLSPHQAEPIDGSDDAWWYEGLTGISVYILSDGRAHACRIKVAQLREWLEKVSP